MWTRLSGSSEVDLDPGRPHVQNKECVARNAMRVIAEGELEGPSSCQRVHGPDESTPIQRSVPITPVLGGLDPAVLSRQLSKLLEKVSAPSVPLEVLESQQKTCEDLTDRLVEAEATVAALEAELKQKDEEIAALKERPQSRKCSGRKPGMLG
ncbi:hypothetical protein R1flu_019413 [Riccia fluitans]|uniref:Uncharacterized protein n=1 Tax=Riccia fluitans TaxID=41844 RepID=A0ABD1ZIK9_9MARC